MTSLSSDLCHYLLRIMILFTFKEMHGCVCMVLVSAVQILQIVQINRIM